MTVESQRELLELALANNPQYMAKQAQLGQSESEQGKVNWLPDPTIGLGAFLEPVETAQGPQIAKISFAQNIPWLSKVKAAQKRSLHQTGIAKAELDEFRLGMQKEIDLIWSEVEYVQTLKEIYREKIEFLANLEDVLSIQYQSGSVSHAGFSKTQMQLLRYNDKLEDLESRMTRIRLNVGELLGLDQPVKAPFFPIIIDTNEPHDELELVTSNHPRVEKLDQQLAVSHARQELARAAFIPDVRIGMDYILTGKREVAGIEVDDSGKDALVLSAGLAIPIWSWSSKRSELKASEWGEKQVMAMKRAQEINIRTQYELNLSRLTESKRQVELISSELLPRSREILNVIQQEYVSQSADISKLNRANQSLLDLELELASAHFSTHKSEIELNYLRGLTYE